VAPRSPAAPLGAATTNGTFYPAGPQRTLDLPAGIGAASPGLGSDEPWVFDPSTATWHRAGLADPITFGMPDAPGTPEPDHSIPLVADLGAEDSCCSSGEPIDELIAYDPATATFEVWWPWAPGTTHGNDVPVPGDVPKGVTRHTMGEPGAIPALADDDGDGLTELATYGLDGT
jgi:hypothetical protein